MTVRFRRTRKMDFCGRVGLNLVARADTAHMLAAIGSIEIGLMTLLPSQPLMVVFIGLVTLILRSKIGLAKL